MKSARTFPWLELAVAAFCAWQASDLIAAWRHSPFDRLGWLAFGIWLLPAFVGLARGSAGVTFTVLGLATALLGRLLDLNAILCLALALACGAFVPASPRRLGWLLGAASWMPLLGWLAHGLPPGAVVLTRVLLAVAAAGLVLLPRRSPPLA